MGKTDDFAGFLSYEGEQIYKDLKDHCKNKLRMMDIDLYELALLANSFDLHSKCAKVCNQQGISISFDPKGKGSNKKKRKQDEDEEPDLSPDEQEVKEGGMYMQVRPEYTVMNKEYQNILKHSPKFGLNPGDREKIFKGLKEEKGRRKLSVE